MIRRTAAPALERLTVVVAAGAGAIVVTARLGALPALEAGAGLLDPNLGTAIAGRIAATLGALLLAATAILAVLAGLHRLARPERGHGAAFWAATAAGLAAWIHLRLWPRLYAAYALVDRNTGTPARHAARAEHLQGMADLALAALVVLLAAAVFALRRSAPNGAGVEARTAGDEPRAPAVQAAQRV